jgi:hypothetical protein
MLFGMCQPTGADAEWISTDDEEHVKHSANAMEHVAATNSRLKNAPTFIVSISFVFYIR